MQVSYSKQFHGLLINYKSLNNCNPSFLFPPSPSTDYIFDVKMLLFFFPLKHLSECCFTLFYVILCKAVVLFFIIQKC